MAMIQTAIQSSNVSRIGWIDETLFVRFNNGRTYTYAGVPIDVYSELVDSPSVGKAFHSLIKDKFPSTAVSDRDPFANS